MKSHSNIAVALIVGAAIGAGAIHGLHAQAKLPAYVIVDIRSVNDPDGLKSVQAKTAPEALAAAGGHYVVRTNDITGLEGTPPKRYVLIAFDSAEEALAWHNSAAQKEVTAIRVKATDSVSFMVEGTAN